MVDFAIPLRQEDAPTNIREALDDPRAAVIAAIIEDTGAAHSYSICIVTASDESVDITDAHSAIAMGYLFGNLVKIAPSLLHAADLVLLFKEAAGKILDGGHEVL